jgi:hypothetical protein
MITDLFDSSQYRYNHLEELFASYRHSSVINNSNNNHNNNNNNNNNNNALYSSHSASSNRNITTSTADSFPLVDLLQELFAYRPEHRISARNALEHVYFTTAPYPLDTEFMPHFASLHQQQSQNTQKPPLNKEKDPIYGKYPALKKRKIISVSTTTHEARREAMRETETAAETIGETITVVEVQAKDVELEDNKRKSSRYR